MVPLGAALQLSGASVDDADAAWASASIDSVSSQVRAVAAGLARLESGDATNESSEASNGVDKRGGQQLGGSLLAGLFVSRQPSPPTASAADLPARCDRSKGGDVPDRGAAPACSSPRVPGASVDATEEGTLESATLEPSASMEQSASHDQQEASTASFSGLDGLASSGLASDALSAPGVAQGPRRTADGDKEPASKGRKAPAVQGFALPPSLEAVGPSRPRDAEPAKKEEAVAAPVGGAAGSSSGPGPRLTSPNAVDGAPKRSETSDTLNSNASDSGAPLGLVKSDAQKRWAKLRRCRGGIAAVGQGRQADLTIIMEALEKAEQLSAAIQSEAEVPKPKPALRSMASSISMHEEGSEHRERLRVTLAENVGEDHEGEHRKLHTKLSRSQSNVSAISLISVKSRHSDLAAVSEAGEEEDLEDFEDSDEDQVALSRCCGRSWYRRRRMCFFRVLWWLLRVVAVSCPVGLLLVELLVSEESLRQELTLALASTATIVVVLLVSLAQPKAMLQIALLTGAKLPWALYDRGDDTSRSDITRTSQTILQQQRDLLHTATSHMNMLTQAVGNEFKLWDELRQEQESLLRGFNKIVTQEASLKRCKSKVVIFVTEADPTLRQQLVDLCRSLKFRVQAFASMEEATPSLLEPVMPAKEDNDSNASSNISGAGKANLLKGRPKVKRDWRPRTFEGSVGYYSESQDDEFAIVALLGASCLPADIDLNRLPEEWRDGGVFVALTGETPEIEAIGRQHFNIGSCAQIRERFRSKGLGVSELLLRPINEEGLSGVVMEAIHLRFREEFLLLENIGQGTWGNVFRSKRLRDGAVLALKMVNSRQLTRKVREAMAREVSLLKAFRWPTMLYLIDSWMANESVQCLLMPLLEGGDLLKETRQAASTGASIDGERVGEWFAQMLHGLCYLHYMGVVHVDIKPANLLIATDKRALMIGDFGSAMLLPGNGPHPARKTYVRKAVTTPVYQSPETSTMDRFYAASDLWSVGVTFYEVATRECLFPTQGEDPKGFINGFDPEDTQSGPMNLASKAIQALRQAVKNAGPVGEELCEQIMQMLRKKPESRPTAAALVMKDPTKRRLQKVLTETGALPDDKALADHFSDFEKLCTESANAASSDAPEMGQMFSEKKSSGKKVKLRRGGSSERVLDKKGH